MKASNFIINKLKEIENLSLKPYLDVAGYPTIGYGTRFYENSEEVKITDPPISQERADSLLLEKINKIEKCINENVKTKLNQNQFDALISFIYNVGETAFKVSTMRAKLNQNDIVGASNQFKRWVYSGGEIIKGLINRREFEEKLFTKEI